MGIRRVVTGHDPDGKAIFASDEQVEPTTVGLLPGLELHRMWALDEAPTFPDDGQAPLATNYFPPVGGFRFGLFTIPPDSTAMPADLDVAGALAEMEVKLPGMAGHMEPDNPGMHTTASVDYEYVVSGRVILELDDGATRELGAGDTVVQNGTRHAWRNPYDEPCQLVVVLIGTEHRALPSGS
jgi:mannose-6-phosphate isomerase-like protein (cupin superfamily)